MKRKGGGGFSKFIGLVAIAAIISSAVWVIYKVETNAPTTVIPKQNVMTGIATQIREALDRKLADEPRTPDSGMMTSSADPGPIPIDESSMEGYSAQTKDTLRLRYNLGLAKTRSGDTMAAIEAFRSVLAIDPQGVYGRLSFIQIGILLDQAGRHAEAIENLKNATRLEPLDALAAHNLGLALMHAGKIEEAKTELHRASLLDGANAGILQNLGNAYATLNQDDLAESSYRAALSISPQNGPIRFNLALTLYRRGDMEAAGAQFKQAAENLSGAEQARAMSFLGMTEYRRGVLSDAARTFGRAANAAPTNPDYRFNEAVAHAKAQENDRAAQAFREVIAITPGDPFAWFGLGGSLYLAGDRSGAMHAYNKGLAIDSMATAPLFTVGYILLEKGDLPAAEEKFRRVIELGGPDKPRAHVNLGLVYEAMGRLDDAELHYEAGDRNDPRKWYNLGLLRRKKGNIDGAVQALKEALEKKPNEPKYSAALGDAYLELGSPDAAISEYEKSVSNGNNDFEIYIRIAQLSTRLERLKDAGVRIKNALDVAQTPKQRAVAYIAEGLLNDKLGDVAAALTSLRNAERADPSNVDIYYNKGIILARSLRYDEAVDALRTAIRINPDHVPSHTQLGNIFAARGLTAEAVAEFEKAVAIDSGAVEANFNLREIKAR